jgi:PmbA protein
MQDLSKKCVDSLLNSGVDKAQAHIVTSEKYELNVAAGEITLLRTTFDTKIDIKAIKNSKKGAISINKTDDASINEAVKSVNELLDTAGADEANDISCKQKAKEFLIGDSKPDLDKMYKRLKNYTAAVKEKYPKIILEEAYLDFTLTKEAFVNSNDVNFKSSKGIYSFMTDFTAKDNEKSSSLNGTYFSSKNIDKELIDCGTIDTLLKQSTEQINTKTMNGKFDGDIIITPDCLGDMISFYGDVFLSDMALISGSSILKDKLNEKVASEKLTIHSRPVSGEIADGYFITQDGFEAKNSTIIDKGVLKAFMLSLYGANKTNKERAVNDGGAYIVEPGTKSFDEIVKSIHKGLLLCRFSGGKPAANGDFSGVAKNSYYIEDGEIKYPVSETMITANLYKMFNDIKDISEETINFGNSILPWICISGVTVSGR